VGRIRAKGGLESAQAAFAAAVGVPELQLDATGVAPPPAQLPSAAQALQRAAARDPVLLAALERLKTQEATTRAVAAQLRPNIVLTSSFSGRDGGAAPSSGDAPAYGGWLPAVPNFDFGLVLRWPLYDGVIRAAVRASRVREEVRRSELDVARRQEEAAVKEAHLAVGIAASALVALERAQEAARKNYEQADARFKGGLGTIVELTDAEALRVDAEFALVLGRFNLARARAALGRLIAERL